jgi:DNA-directed RNA polymerase specialized sigma24 family protein
MNSDQIVAEREYFANLVQQLATCISARQPALLRAGLLEDAIQETHLRVQSWLAKGGTVDNPKGWVCTVARNVAADILNDRDRRLLFDAVSLIDWEETIAAPAIDPLKVDIREYKAEFAEDFKSEASAVTEILDKSSKRFYGSQIQARRFQDWLGRGQQRSGVSSCHESTLSKAVRSAQEWAIAGSLVLMAESRKQSAARLLVGANFASRRPFNVRAMQKFDSIRNMPIDWESLKPGFELAWDVAATRLIQLLENGRGISIEADIARACEWILCMSARVYRDAFGTAFRDLWASLARRRLLHNIDVRRTMATIGAYCGICDWQRDFIADQTFWPYEISNVLAFIASARRNCFYPIHSTFNGQPESLLNLDCKTGLMLHHDLAHYAIRCMQSPRYDCPTLNAMVLVWTHRLLTQIDTNAAMRDVPDLAYALEANRNKLAEGNKTLFSSALDHAHRLSRNN